MGRLSKSAFAILWLSFGAGLTGCGFTPLYATPGMTPSLQAIDLVVPKERIGYLLEEQLNDELGHKSASPIRYQLTCTTRCSAILEAFASTMSPTATRSILRSTTPCASRAAPRSSCRAPLRPSSITTQPIRLTPGSPPSRTGRHRAANQAAIQIRLALSRYFAGVHAGSHPAETPETLLIFKIRLNAGHDPFQAP